MMVKKNDIGGKNIFLEDVKNYMDLKNFTNKVKQYL